MLERHWPWLVSIAAPAAASACLLLWVALAPQVWDSTTAMDSEGLHNAAQAVRPTVSGDRDDSCSRNRAELFVAADRDGDGVLSALEYRENLLPLSVAAQSCEERQSSHP
jgi:hypothetical protein